MVSLSCLSRAAVAAVTVFLSGGPAHADVEICTRSQVHRYRIAIAWQDSATKQWQSSGWYTPTYRKCMTAPTGPIAGRPIYLHATYRIKGGGRQIMTVDLTTGQSRPAKTEGVVRGEHRFCVKTSRFDIVGDRRCTTRGVDREGFVELPVSPSADALLTMFDEGAWDLQPR